MLRLGFSKCMVYFLCGFLLLLISCQKDIIESNESIIPDIVSNEFKEGDIILGEQIENPYSLKNMQLAYNSIASRNRQKAV